MRATSEQGDARGRGRPYPYGRDEIGTAVSIGPSRDPTKSRSMFIEVHAFAHRHAAAAVSWRRVRGLRDNRRVTISRGQTVLLLSCCAPPCSHDLTDIYPVRSW